MIAIINVISVEYNDAFCLRVRFSNGASGVHDFAGMVAEPGDMTEPLRDPAVFKRVYVEMGVLTWPNGFDLDAIQLHTEMADAGELTHKAAE